MEILFELSKKLWYLWVLVIGAGVLEIFMPKIKGFLGEKSVALLLSGLDKTKYKLINNIMLRVGDKTTQIDHVIVSNYGIFVIETKNYKGWIIGNEFNDNWKQVIYKRKEKLQNPIKQNYGHIQALKEILNDFGDINYISIVAFTTRAELKVTSKTDVVYTINLPKTIKKYMSENITDLVKEDVYAKLISLNVDSKETRKTHVKAIHKTLAKKDIKVNRDICPKCGGKLILRNGKYGQFKGCSSFPKCRFIAK
ncbi:NERD domain-containing protein [Clostridium lacusfryxellense]|uniref:NERD domain-containing protein n=1 Tax=Clostridium lacusfryxellense TaxID=205328 RepID=UPI001C0B3D15|nr:NERD domain-containing protein [Clostridium lacusfryxellense]MBU3110170.1 NERD domain-containing protein [Clostridium lacusfryxellense]